MTGAGGDVLAWTKAAIKRVELTTQHATQAAWRTHDTFLEHGGHTATILAGRGNDTEVLAWLPTMSDEPWDDTRNAWRNADHIALHDPASVLRRCAADRKLLELHAPVDNHGRFSDGNCPADCDGQHDQPPVCRTCRDYAGDPLPFPCRTVELVAEGYGWTDTTDSRRTEGAQTPPAEGDQMT